MILPFFGLDGSCLQPCCPKGLAGLSSPFLLCRTRQGTPLTCQQCPSGSSPEVAGTRLPSALPGAAVSLSAFSSDQPSALVEAYMLRRADPAVGTRLEGKASHCSRGQCAHSQDEFTVRSVGQGAAWSLQAPEAGFSTQASPW